MIEQISPAIVVRLPKFRDEVIAEVVLLRRFVAIVSLQQTDDELRRVRPVVHRIGPQRLRRGLFEIIGKRLLVGARQTQITRQHIPRAHIRCALNIRVAALRVDSAAGHSDVAQHELKHGRSVDELHGVAVLRPAQCVKNGSLPVRLSGGADDRSRLLEVCCRTAADGSHHLRRVARVMVLHQLKHGAWMFHGRIDLRVTGRVELIVPTRFVVRLLVFVPA